MNEIKNPERELLFEECLGIRKYALEQGVSTEKLLEGTILQSSEEVSTIVQASPEKYSSMSAEEIVKLLAPKVVSKVTYEHMSSGLSIPRVFWGGKYELADVINAASCVDAAVFTREVLSKGFGIEAEIKKTRLGVVKDHHYLELPSGEVIDPVIDFKGNRKGYFKNKELFERQLSIINSAGISVLIKQIQHIISSGQRNRVYE